jgi:hypothetical protein
LQWIEVDVQLDHRSKRLLVEPRKHPLNVHSSLRALFAAHRSLINAVKTISYLTKTFLISYFKLALREALCPALANQLYGSHKYMLHDLDFKFLQNLIRKGT